MLNEHIFGGCDRTGAPANANVQSGDATVGSDWIASTFEVRVRNGIGATPDGNASPFCNLARSVPNSAVWRLADG